MRQAAPWDETWMSMAQLFANLRVKDPEWQIGAVVVGPDNLRPQFGYNGLPRKIKDTPERWDNEAKKPLVIHAERNAIQNARTDLTGWTLYVTLFPCLPCATQIIQSGISRVVYRDEPKKGCSWDQKDKTLELFKEAQIVVQKHGQSS